MSSDYVRAAFADAWPAFAGALPLVPIVNIPPAASVIPFGAMTFAVETRRDVSLGRPAWVDEAGIVTVGVYGPAGEGDAAVSAIASEMQRELATLRIDPAIEIRSVDGPHDYDPAGEGEVYGQQLSVSYTYTFREP